MFRRLGAEVVHGPTISTRKVPDPDLLRARTQELVQHPPDFLIADTGIGIRTWVQAAQEWGLEEPLRAALAGTRIAVRGPKAAGAITSIGLSAWWKSPEEQLADLIDHLETVGLTGQRVAFQLHGDDGSEFVARLEAAGATVTTLPVYVWADPEDPGPAQALIEKICAGTVHAVTFTAGVQVRGLTRLAGDGGRAELLRRLNSSTLVACIGPVCAAAAREQGILEPAEPENWRLGSLVKLVSERLSGSTVQRDHG
jgi:uroporphyrinogen-III synthase